MKYIINNSTKIQSKKIDFDMIIVQSVPNWRVEYNRYIIMLRYLSFFVTCYTLKHDFRT